MAQENQTQQEFAVWLRKLCINLQGWDAEGGDGREVRKGGDICIKPSEVAQSCLTLCDPVDCSPPGSSIHGIFQARVLEWVAISFSRDLPDPGIEPRSPAFQADALPPEPPEPYESVKSLQIGPSSWRPLNQELTPGNVQAGFPCQYWSWEFCPFRIYKEE